MTDRTALLCLVCPQDPPRRPDRPMVCESCRVRIRRDLAAIAADYELLPLVLEPGRGGPGRSAAGYESRPPVNMRVLSALGPGQVWPTGERDDDLPPLVLLDQWVRIWVEERGQDEHRPVPTVALLAGWLGLRLDWACASFPAVDEFAASISATARQLAAVTRPGPRGESAGRCPQILRDESRCNATLRADPYVSVITCPRCATSWHRDGGGWLKLRAEQLAAA